MKISDAQCLAAWEVHDAHDILCVHEAPFFVVRNTTLPRGDQILWLGSDQNLAAAEQQVIIEQMRVILEAALLVH